ncbi:MAG TPA: DegT/DnrJ/EryC1/StrS family aminotransferase [bacterium]|nr:DegT/DnrJ/EryC1/StrS family aminotransferase [bacterium]
MQITSQPTIPIAAPMLTDEDTRRVLDVLQSGQLVAGRRVREFEQAFTAYLGVAHGAATSSGSTALEVALEAVGAPPGARVITTPFSFVATTNAILRRGAIPVFADIDPETYNLNPHAVADVVARTPDVWGLLPVHLYGLPCPMDALMVLARRHHLVVIEDAAQAHGAAFRGRKVGTLGDAGIFSFYPSKNLTTGEGGMVVTGDAGVAVRARMLANVGQSAQYVYEAVASNARMTEMAAAIGIGQLATLDERNLRRRHNAARLSAELRDLDWLGLPVEPEGSTHVYHQYTLRVPGHRDRLVQHLAACGIGTRVYYPTPIHRSPLYQRLGYGDARCPEAERAAGEVLSIPVHPALGEEELRRIVQAIRRFDPRH